MSTEALAWVLNRNRASRGYDRLVLIAYADQADTGTGYCFPSLETLHQLSRVSRSSIPEVRDRLVADGQLLARAPARSGRGHHYEYVVVMGRDPYALADLWGWPRPVLSHEARATARRELWLPVEGPPPRGHRSPRPAGGSLVPKKPPERYRKGTGNPPPGGDSPAPAPARGRAARSSRPAPAAAATSTCTLPPDELGPLRAQLAGLNVSWHMTAEQQAAIAALLRIHGARPLAERALDLVSDKGEPTFARAWLGAWRALPVTAAEVPMVTVPWCGSCEAATHRFVVDDDGRPVRKCHCHPANHTAPAF